MQRQLLSSFYHLLRVAMLLADESGLLGEMSAKGTDDKVSGERNDDVSAAIRCSHVPSRRQYRILRFKAAPRLCAAFECAVSMCKMQPVLRCVVQRTTCSATVKLQQQEVRCRRGGGPCAEAAGGGGTGEEAPGRGLAADLAAALQAFLRGLLPASRHFTDELLGATLQLLLSAPAALLQPRVNNAPCCLTRCPGADSLNVHGLMGACSRSTGLLCRAQLSLSERALACLLPKVLRMVSMRWVLHSSLTS